MRANMNNSYSISKLDCLSLVGGLESATGYFMPLACDYTKLCSFSVQLSVAENVTNILILA